MKTLVTVAVRIKNASDTTDRRGFILMRPKVTSDGIGTILIKAQIARNRWVVERIKLQA